MHFGYQSIYDTNFFEAIAYARKHRFAYVSFDLNVPRFYIERLSTAELQAIRRYAAEMGVGLAFHLPGDNVSLYADYPAIRRGILEHFTAILHAAEALGARHVTVHTGNCPSFKQANAQEDAFIVEYGKYFSAVLDENLRHLAAQTSGVMLCVENYLFTPITMATIAKLLADGTRLYLTWDLAKTYTGDPLQRNAEIAAFMWQHQHYIREIHAHDLNTRLRSHQIIGEGIIDFSEYIPLFRRDYIATTLEVRPRKAATISRDRLLSLITD